MSLALLIPLALQAAAPAACAVPAAPPAAFAGWNRAGPLEAGRAMAAGRAYRVPLGPVAAVRFPAGPEKTPAAGSLAATAPLSVARAGTYRVALDSGVWLDLVSADGTRLISTGHGHGPACTGIRKIVDFRLAPGRYTLQLSGATSAAVRVMVAPA